MFIVLRRIHFRSFTTLHEKFYSNSNLVNILRNMPKEQKHIHESQRQRLRIKDRQAKYVPGRVMLQVLGTGAEGAPRSFYLFSDQQRYLFNGGEGSQRLAHEHKMKLAKLEHIFITQSSWKNIGGLPGIALTIQDVGVPQITLHGPKGIEELFNATKRFVIIKDLQINLAECTEETKYEDNVMTVEYIPLYPLKDNLENILEDSKVSNLEKNVQAGTGNVISNDAATSTRRERHRNRSKSRTPPPKFDSLIEDDVDYYAHERKHRPRKRNRSRSSSVSGRRTASTVITPERQTILNQIKNQAVSMAYACKLQPRPGALNLDKCVKCGVPPGPLLGQLKSGQDVTLDSGKIVMAKDVCEPDDPGPVFIVVDCPNEDYLSSLLKNEAFKKYQQTATEDTNMAYLVVHFTPSRIYRDVRYKQWMERFSPSTNHLVLNDSNTCLGSSSVHRIQYKLNLLSEELFPLLGDTGSLLEDEADGHITKRIKTEDRTLNGEIETMSIEKLTVKSNSNESNVQANTFLTYHLRPKKGRDTSDVLKITPSSYLEETTSIEGFNELLHGLKDNFREKRASLTIKPYPRILFLGTGSCIPNKTRNTSGILLQISDTKNILMDCGEGTFGQLVRFFGVEEAYRVLANIKVVYISHLHADHHIGLVGLLQGRRRALERLKLEKNPMYLLAPYQISSWLNFYDNCFEDILNEIQLIPNQNIMYENVKLPEALKEEVLNSLGMSSINTVYVRHCPNAFGVALTHESGYKITYSGDTMPCDNLVKLGLNSDLLIHEATMEDELHQEAIIKMHSTTSQAIDVGTKMQAKFILLTHFSQRYAKLPRFNDNFSDNVGIAFDNMMVKLDELPLLPMLYPTLKLMFAEHYEELENKAVKRQLRMERSRAASRERSATRS